jgi:Lamin Tail Domain/Divergent InlB B-repeat domain
VSGRTKVAVVLATAAVVAALAPAGAQASTSGLVISQVYTSGGVSGATYENDYIELFNGGPAAVDLTGYSVQYANSPDTSWSDTQLSPVSPLSPGQYYLVAEASDGTDGSDLGVLMPNQTGIIALAPTAGKVALVSSGTSLSGACPKDDASVVDFVGYGSGTNCYEGSGPSPSPAATTAIKRAGEGCNDSDFNGVDFSAGPADPRSTLSSTNDCYRTLTVTKAGAGFGTVSGPDGLSCSASCTHRYPKGTAITLTATPGGSVFSGWSGDCSGQSCELTMDSDHAVTATFDPDSPPVLAAVGNRSVTAGQTLSFQLSATDANGDPLSYQGNNLPAGAAVSEDGAFSWTPTLAQVGVTPTLAQVGVYDNVRMQVADTRDGGDFEDITITVNPAASHTSIAVAKKGKGHHRRYVAMGSVTPSDPGAKLTMKLLRKKHGAFKLVERAHPKLSPGGEYAASFKRPGPGKCEITADYPGTSGVAPSTAVKKFGC